MLLKLKQFEAEEIISYTEMCAAEGMSLQHGMNYRGDDSIFLMSRRPGAPYDDAMDLEKNQLIYEGHDEPRRSGIADPKKLDQPLTNKVRNRKFFDAAQTYVEKKCENALRIRVYEKLKPGIWVFNGTFALESAWVEESNGRNVVKFGLTLLTKQQAVQLRTFNERLSTARLIPSSVKQEVYKRDAGQCVLCGSKTNLHFDHDLAYVHGGTSLLAENIRLLCATHNLRKGARIE